MVFLYFPCCSARSCKDKQRQRQIKLPTLFLCFSNFHTCCSIGTSRTCKKSKDIAPFFLVVLWFFHSFRIMSNLSAQNKSMQISKIKKQIKKTMKRSKWVSNIKLQTPGNIVQYQQVENDNGQIRCRPCCSGMHWTDSRQHLLIYPRFGSSDCSHCSKPPGTSGHDHRTCRPRRQECCN